MPIGTRILALCLLCSAFLLHSCATVSRITAGEPASKEDATPPPDYHPIYIRQVAQIPDAPQVRKPSLEISWIDAREPNHVKIYAHLVDSTGTYLMGAASSKWRSKWCEIDDSIAGNWQTISKYGLKEITELQRVPTALALVMDHSGSMGEDRAHVMQDAAENLIGRMQAGDAMTLIKYDNKVQVEAPLSTVPSELKRQLNKTGLEGYGGSTAIIDAVAAGVHELDKAQLYERKAVVIFTDGQDNSSTLDRDSLLQIARRSNTLVCAIGFGLGINQQYLLDITGPTGGLYRHVYGTHEIDEVFEDLYHRLKNYYVIDYVPSSYGLHTAAIQLCLPKDTLLAEGTYDNTPRIGDLSLLDVNFNTGSADIFESSKPAIENVLTLMKAFPLLTIEVRGHTDSTGDPTANQSLSKRRAESVRAALVKKGIAGGRITSNGFGDTMPIADNKTDDGRASNRRTEFVIVSK